MARPIKDFTPEQLRDRIAECMRRASTYFPAAHNMLGGKWEAYAKEAGVDLNLAALSEHSLDYSLEDRRAFHLGYRFYFRLDAWRDDIEVQCELNWASGGGDPVTANAQAALYVEAAGKAAQCQLVAQDALGTLRMRDDEDREVWRAAVKLFQSHVKAAQANIKAVHDKHEPDEEN